MGLQAGGGKLPAGPLRHAFFLFSPFVHFVPSGSECHEGKKKKRERKEKSIETKKATGKNQIRALRDSLLGRRAVIPSFPDDRDDLATC